MTTITNTTWAALATPTDDDTANEALQARLLREHQRKYYEQERLQRYIACQLLKTRENGYWKEDVFNRLSAYLLEVPLTVNEHAMHFVELFLVNYPEVTRTCSTVGDLRQVFSAAYIPYALVKFEKYIVASEYLINIQGRVELKDSTAEQQCLNINKWAIALEHDYHKHHYSYRYEAPWANPFWVFAKNVTFEKCLHAMSERSQTFEMETLNCCGAPNRGFIRMALDYNNTACAYTKITWLIDDLATYRAIPHKNKALCKHTLAQQLAIMDHWY